MFGGIHGVTVSAVTLVGALALSACTQPGGRSKEATGTAMGANVCRTAAKYLPGEATSLLRSMGVSTLGASMYSCGYLGGQMGLALDDMDREKMNEAAQAALDTGEVTTWDNGETASSGSAQVLKTAPTGRGRGECKTVRNTIILADGSRKQEDVTACRNADGGWEAAGG